MTVEITREIQGLALGMGLELEFFLHCFVSLTKPSVILSRDAANALGCLANVVELEANKRHYCVLVDLPQVRFSETEVEWTVSYDGEVTIEGQVTPATIFDDKRLIASRRDRIQLCPTEPWAILFNLSGPVEYGTTQVYFTTNNYMENLSDVVDCTMNYNGDVTIIGHIPPSAIFADRPITRYRRNRVQLCPTEPWAIFFGFPSPVDWCTASLTLPSNDDIVISMRKRRPPTVRAATSSTTLVVDGVTWYEMDMED